MSDAMRDIDLEPEDCCPSCYTQTEEHQDGCEYHAEKLRDEDADRGYDLAREDRNA